MNIVRIHFKSINSTNTWAMQHYNEFPPQSITLVTAEEQTAGRGRRGRRWQSPAGSNLYGTFCLFASGHIANIPQVLALACAEVLERCGLNPQLKWPNDILVDGKKIAGILCETRRCDNEWFVATGIGLNINSTESDFIDLSQAATSLKITTGKEFDVNGICRDLETRFIQHIEMLLREGFHPFITLFQGKMDLGDQAIVRADNQEWEGIIEGLNDDGTLRLRLLNGEIKTLNYGEIAPHP